MRARFKRPVTTTTVESVHVIELHGEFDLSNVGPVALHLDAAIRAGAPAIVVDLTDAAFVNSTLVNALFQACRDLALRGGRLSIVTCDPHALKVMELTALDQAASVHGAVEEAALSTNGDAGAEEGGTRCP